MQIKYYPEVDMLNIDFSTAPGADAEEVTEGFVFTYDAQGCLVGIEVDQASKRVYLKEIEKNDAYLITMGEVSTVSTLAAELGVGERSIQKTIQAMRAARIEVGLQESPAHPILLTEADVLAVKRWREQHPRGRPRVAVEG
jgi:uncharacterized protein YuzE